MLKKLKKFIAPIIVLLIVCGVGLWFSRNIIITVAARSVIENFAKEKGFELDYQKLTANSESININGLDIFFGKGSFSANSISAKVSPRIIFARSKLMHIEDVSISGFELYLKTAEKEKPEKVVSYPRKIQSLTNRLTTELHCSITVNYGRIIIDRGENKELIELTQASVLPEKDSQKFNFQAATAEGILPYSSIEGVINLAAPGSLEATAMLNLLLFDNSWYIEPLSINADWNESADFKLTAEAKAGDAQIKTIYETNLLEASLAVLEIKADGLEITEKQEANKFHLSQDMLDFLGDDLKKFLTDNKLHGKGGFDARFTYDSQSSQTDYDIRIDVASADMIYGYFPYPLKSLHGSISANNNRFALDLTTDTPEQINIAANITKTPANKNRDIDIRVQSPNLPVDENLYNALQASERRVWDSFNPEGFVQIDYHRYSTPEGKTDYKLDIMPKSCNILYEAFAYPLKNVYGKFTITRDKVVLKDMQGDAGKGQVVLNGTLTGFAEDKTDINLLFDCKQIALDDVFINALPADAQNLINQIDIKNAAADIKVNVQSKEGKDFSYIADVKLSAEKLAIEQIPANFVAVKADLLLTDNNITINAMDTTINEQLTSISGSINLDENNQSHSYNINFESKNAEFSKFANLFGQADDYKIEIDGKTNISGNFFNNRSDKPNYEIAIELKDNAIRYRSPDIELTNAKGVINVDNEQISYEITALMTATGGEVSSNGKIISQQQPKAIISAKLSNIKSTAEFLPGGINISDSSNLNLTFTDAIIKEGIIICDNVELDFENLTIEDGIIKDMTGSLTGSAKYSTAKGLSFKEAHLKAQKVLIANHLAERIEAKLDFDIENGLRSSEPVTAKVYDGNAIASFAVNNDENKINYEFSVDFHNVNISNFFNAFEQEFVKGQFQIEGLCSGQLYLKGIAGDESSRFGRLSFEVENVKVAERTIFDRIFDTLLARSGNYRMHKLKVDSYIRRSSIILDEVEMLLPIMLLKGGGNINLQRQDIDLTLTAHGLNIELIGDISRLLWFEAIGKAIAKVEVSGALEQPEVSVTTLGLFRN